MYFESGIPHGPKTDLQGNIRPEWRAYELKNTADFFKATRAGDIEVAKIQAGGAVQVAGIQIKPQLAEVQSLTPLRVAQGQSTILRARTQNLKTTADVSQQVQKPVQAELVRSLPWVAGGAVSLILLGVILYRTKK